MRSVKVARVRDCVPREHLPSRGTEHAAGYDLHAAITWPTEIAPGEARMVETGLAMEIPVGWFGRIVPRSSSLMKRGLHVATATIDADYRGEIWVVVMNVIKEPVEIAVGERIAQLIFQRHEVPEFVEIEPKQLSETARGQGGFGSTGR